MIKKRTAWRILFCLLFCLGVGFAAGITAFSDGQVQEQPASTLFSTKSTWSTRDTLLTRAVDQGLVQDTTVIKQVSFVDLNGRDLTGVATADYSAEGNGGVLAWFDSDTSVLYIGGYGTIVAGDSLSYAFFSGQEENYIDSISGLDMLDTSNVTDMSSMFYQCGSSSTVFTLDLGANFDTSNVTNMSNMFSRCGYSSTAFTLDLGENFDTSNVTNMASMFSRCGYSSTAFTLDLGEKFDTSKVTNMASMFYQCGYSNTAFTLYLGANFNTTSVMYMGSMFYQCGNSSTVFTLYLGEKFDTSNVTDMSSMFYQCGYRSTAFTLDLGEKFDTSNVTDMSRMFYRCGYYSPEFTLDLGENFDTRSVTDMSRMFYQCGSSSTALTLDLGEKFDTSNVTDMSSMFYQCGYSSTALTLDLGEKFDTSNVTNMGSMFYQCGSSSTVFELHLGANFDTGNVTNMSYMFFHCGLNSAVFTLDLGDKFDTSNVTNMAHMFEACGQNSTVFTLDLGENFDTGSVTNMTYMFSNCGCSSTVFTLDLGDKFDTSNVTDMSRMFFACGDKSTKFTTLDLSGFTVSSTAKLTDFAMALNVGTFIFGEGWAAATLPEADAFDYWADSISEKFPTMVIGATDNLLGYNWQSDSRVLIVAHIVTASAGEGGTVSGGGAVETGGSITLTATANDGYTFEGWYDGGTKVCETAVFVVENVTADQTYTAQFTAEAVVPDPEPGTEPDPEPVWEKPYLSWDGTTLTLTDHAAVTNKVGIVYTGGALFDAGAIDWYELVAAGKEYKSLNGTSGYAVYPDFTSRTPKTTGNYVAFVKYAQEDGLLTADYITFSVGGAQSFEVPALRYDDETKTLTMIGTVESTIGVAYVGDAVFDANSVTWDAFVSAGQAYPDKNGSSGYAKASKVTQYSKTFGTNGNFVAFLKYEDPNLHKAITKYYTFTVTDARPGPVDPPAIKAETDTIVLETNGRNVTKVTINYIGTENKSITNWDEFLAAAAPYSRINGPDHNQQYFNPADGTGWRQDKSGYYEVYVRYVEDGETLTNYCTVQITATTDAPEAAIADSAIRVTANGNTIDKVCVAYIGAEDLYIDNWNDYVAAGQKYAAINGEDGCVMTSSPAVGETWNAEESGYYCLFIRYITEDGVAKSFYVNVNQ